MKVDWPAININATANLSCNGSWACAEMNFPIPDPDIPFQFACDTENECYGSTINCPINADCNIICSDDTACKVNTLYFTCFLVCK